MQFPVPPAVQPAGELLEAEGAVGVVVGGVAGLAALGGARRLASEVGPGDRHRRGCRGSRQGDAGDARRARAGPRRGHFPYPVAVRVGNKEIAGTINGDRSRIVQTGRGRGPTVAGISAGAIAGDGVDVARCHRDAVIVPVLAATTRMRLLFVSAITTLPEPSTASPWG